MSRHKPRHSAHHRADLLSNMSYSTKPSGSSNRATRMVIGGGKSNATKDLLRSMLHAWYDLTKDEAGAWAGQLEAEVALQQEMKNPVNACYWVFTELLLWSSKVCRWSLHTLTILVPILAVCCTHPPETIQFKKRVPHASPRPLSQSMHTYVHPSTGASDQARPRSSIPRVEAVCLRPARAAEPKESQPG